MRGETVFQGYYNLPEAQADAFTPDGWFRTGDLGVHAPRACIRVVDRVKDMLLVGGENVYTTEVESVLHAHPAVRAAAVFGVASRVMGELVGAAVTLDPSVQPRPDPAALIAWCAERLAEYKVPSAVHILDAMPVTGELLLAVSQAEGVQCGALQGWYGLAPGGWFACRWGGCCHAP